MKSKSSELLVSYANACFGSESYLESYKSQFPKVLTYLESKTLSQVTSSRLKLLSELKKHGYLEGVRDLISKPFQGVRLSDENIPYFENLLFLAFIDQDSVSYKNYLKLLCKFQRVLPEKLILRVLGVYQSDDLLVSLPHEIARIYSRPELIHNIFEPDCDQHKLLWLFEHGSADDRALASFVLNKFNEVKKSEGVIVSVLRFWQEQKYEDLLQRLSGIHKLIESGKIKKERFNFLIVMIHVLSLLRHHGPREAREVFLAYQTSLGTNTMMRVLDIAIDYQAGNIKRTKLKLKQLVYGFQGKKSELFFRSLAYFWINDGCSARELQQLKELREEYLVSVNKFLFSEVDALLMKIVSAEDFSTSIRDRSFPFLCDLFVSSQSWTGLLESLQKNAEPSILLWLVRLDSGSSKQTAWCEIEPALAVRKSKKKLSPPKIISWQDLLERQDKLELLEADLKIINLLHETDEDNHLSYAFPEKKALELLSGAENAYLMDEPEQQLVITKRSPELSLKESNTFFELEWDYPTHVGDLHIEEVDDFKYEVCYLSDAEVLLREKVEASLHLPKDPFKVHEFIGALNRDIVLKGDLPLSSASKEQAAKTELLCRFDSSGVEYMLEVLVQAPWEGYTQCPGQGASVILEKFHGKSYEWQRDLALEKKIYHQLMDSLDLDPSLGYEFEIYDRQHLLEILDTLHEKKNIKLQWPKELKITAHRYSAGSISVKASESRDWFQIEGKLVFNKTVVELAKVLEKMKTASRFIELKDNQYLILTEELRQQLVDISQLVDQREECLLLHSALAEQINSQLTGVPVDLEEDILFKDAVTRAIYAKREVAQTPHELKATLRPYQETGFRWLTQMTAQNIGVCLADDMGLGKTLQTLVALLLKQAEGPSIVVAPTSLCMNWCQEGKKFTPTLNFINYTSANRSKLLSDLSAGDVLVLSYSILIHDCELLSEKIWNVMVLDEAQMVKNTGTLRSKSIRLLQSQYRIALSGTPLENHTGELWNIFDILNPGLLGNRSAFNKNFALPIERGDKVALKKLRSRIKPFLLRRLRKNVLDDLPESQESTLSVEMSEQEMELYNAHRYQAIKNLKKFRKEQGPKKKKIEILAEITRLRIAAANPQIVDPQLEISNKSRMLINKLISLVENKHKTLIFSQFVGHLDVIQNLLENENMAYSRLDGSMNQKQRQKAIQQFSEGNADCMLISLKAGGVGLNLTAADHVIHMDPWWNPAVEDQAVARALRIGQKNKVNVIRFISQGTIEEDIVKLHENKRNLADDLLRGSSKASKLSIDELLTLIESS